MILFLAATVVGDSQYRKDMPRVRFEPAHNLSSGLLQWSCACCTKAKLILRESSFFAQGQQCLINQHLMPAHIILRAFIGTIQWTGIQQIWTHQELIWKSGNFLCPNLLGENSHLRNSWRRGRYFAKYNFFSLILTFLSKFCLEFLRIKIHTTRNTLNFLKFWAKQLRAQLKANYYWPRANLSLKNSSLLSNEPLNKRKQYLQNPKWLAHCKPSLLPM